MRQTRNMHRSLGFTLIEMLLVVSIIAFLISIILPAMGKVKNKAQISVCVSNLKNIYGATLQYTTDNERRLPNARTWVNGYWWYQAQRVREGTLFPYMGESESSYVCPEFVDSKDWWEAGYQNQTAAWSYSMNEYFQVGWQSQRPIQTISGIQQGDQIHLYSDENPWKVPGYSNHTINNGAMGVGALNNAGSIVDSIGSYHDPPGGNKNDGFSNVAFVDGHIELVHVSKTKLIVTPIRIREAMGWSEGDPY